MTNDENGDNQRTGRFTGSFEKLVYGLCGFFAFLAMVLVIVGCATPNWLATSFTFYSSTAMANVTGTASIGFFQFCYDIVDSQCLKLTDVTAAPVGLLVVGIVLLALSIVLCLALAILKTPSFLAFAPVIVFSLASILILAGYAISWYYVFASMKTTVVATLLLYKVRIDQAILIPLIQGIQAGYSYNLAVAGGFFTYAALVVAAYACGSTRKQ